MTSRLLQAAVLILVTLRLCIAQVSVSGRVVDEDNVPVAGADVSVRPANEPASSPATVRAVSDPTGAFTATLPSAGSYLITVKHVDFFALTDRPAEFHEGENEIELAVNHVRNTSQSVNVSSAPSPIDIEQTDSERHLTGPQILEVPYPSTENFRNALSLTPGVVTGPAGDLHFDGGTESQVEYLLDGFDIGDPLTGTFNTHLSVESVRSFDLLAGRYSPEYGKGASGALAIHTEAGDDSWRYSATDFIPGIDTNNGLHAGTYTPRFNFSGPIVKGRAWLSDSVDADYNELIVPGLPSGQNSRKSFGASNLLHAQFNLTPANILFSDFLVNFNNTPNSGLGALSPIPTTVDQRMREWFFSAKDQIYFGPGMLVEFGFGDLTTFARSVPQGDATYLITPNGTQGNYYVDSTQNSVRKQFLSNLFLPKINRWGSHEIKAGIDVDRLDYSQDIRRTAFDNVGLAGNVLRQVMFEGSGVLARPSLEASSYILDNWKIKPNLYLQAGVRQDWDELVRDLVFSPRVSLSYAPFGLKNTKLSAGYAIVYDETPPQLFTRPSDQYSLTTIYNPDGSIQSGPAATVFTIRPHLEMSQYRNWSGTFEQLLPERILLNVNLLSRRNNNGLTYVNILNAGPPPAALIAAYNTAQFEGIYELENAGTASYDSAEIRLHQPFGKGYEWMASYTRSRAASNAVTDVTVDQPTIIQDNSGRLAWDVPNRFLSWGYLPTFWKNWAIGYLFETRTGFPFSVVDETGRVLGAPNVDRFPSYLNLNFHVEWTTHAFGYRFALRGGFNNITNHNNYTVVNSTFGSPQFLTFYGSDGRHFVLRIRWLGHEKN